MVHFMMQALGMNLKIGGWGAKVSLSKYISKSDKKYIVQ